MDKRGLEVRYIIIIILAVILLIWALVAEQGPLSKLLDIGGKQVDQVGNILEGEDNTVGTSDNTREGVRKQDPYGG